MGHTWAETASQYNLNSWNYEFFSEFTVHKKTVADYIQTMSNYILLLLLLLCALAYISYFLVKIISEYVLISANAHSASDEQYIICNQIWNLRALGLIGTSKLFSC